MNTASVIKSKTDQVIDHISTWLRSGELKIGDRLPSERELAQRLGVSLLTINKAMARLEDAALISRAAGRGTHVVNLPSPDAIAIICDICHLSNPARSPFAEILIESLLKTTKDSGLVPHFLIGKGKNAPEFLSSLGIQSAVWNNVKGAIALAWCDGVEETLTARGIPLVTISCKDQGRNSVIPDYDKLGIMAAGFFLETGENNIHVIYNDTFDEFEWNNPVRTFRAEMEKHGIDCRKIHFHSITPSRESGFTIGEQLKNESGAIFFTDENITAGFAEYLRNNNHGRIPASCPRVITQISGNSPLSIPDTFVRLEFSTSSICRESVGLLDDLLAHKPGAPWRRFIAPVLLKNKNIASKTYK